MGNESIADVGTGASPVVDNDLLTPDFGQLVGDNARVRPENSEVERLCADFTKAGELLGWAPRVQLKDGLCRTISWIEQNLGGYRVSSYAV